MATINEIMAPVELIEKKMLEQNFVLVQILEILKGKKLWRTSAIDEAQKKLQRLGKMLTDAECVPEGQQDEKQIRKLRTSITNTKKSLSILQQDTVQFDDVGKAFKSCATEFSSLKFQVAAIRTHVDFLLGGGQGLTPKMTVGDKEKLDVDEPFTDDGFNAVQQKLKKTSNAFVRMQLTADALSQVPSTVEGFRSKHTKLVDRINKLQEGTPEHQTSVAMRDKVQKHIKTIEGRAEVLLAKFGEAAKLVINRTDGLTEQMRTAVQLGHLRKVAKKVLPPVDIALAHIKSNYNGD